MNKPTRSPLAALLLLAMLAAGGQAAAQNAVLTVEVEGFSSTKGLLRLAVFRSADGWPRDPAKVFRTASVPINTPLTTVAFEGLVPGTYAVSIYHDENNNGKLDRNFLGIPSESYGFSNNARAAFGPPKFNKASFTLALPGKTIRTRIK